ncbi:DNA replication protein psf2 [Pestalotiopsis sp. IQ-011]
MVFQRLRAFIGRQPYVAAAIAAARANRHVYILCLQVITFLIAVQLFLAGSDVMQARYEERWYAAMRAAELAEKLAEMTPLEQEVFGVDGPVVVTPAEMTQSAGQPDSELYYPERPRYIYTVDGEKVPMLGPRKPQLLNPEDQRPWIERGWSTVDDTPPVVEGSSADDDGAQHPGMDESTVAEPEMGTSSTSTTTPKYEVATTPLGELTFVGIGTTVTAESTTNNSVLTESARTRESVTSVTVIDSRTVTRAGQTTTNSGPTTMISIKFPLLPTIATLVLSPNITAVVELEAIANSATEPTVSGIAGTLATLKNLTLTGGAPFVDPEELGKWWPGTTEELIEFIHKPRIYNKSKDRVGWSRAASDRFWAEMERLYSESVFGARLLAASKGLMKPGKKPYSILEQTLDWACETAMPEEWASYGLWVVCLARDSRQ